MISNVFNHVGYLEKSLDSLWLRNEITANNISNIDTPNFKASTVEFESILEDKLNGKSIKMKQTNSRHINHNESSLQPRVVLNDDTTYRMDGNNVDIEKEQIDLAKNAIHYNAVIQKASKELSRLKYVITEGK